MMKHFDPLDRSDREKFEIFKIEDCGGRHLEKSINRNISAAFGPISTKFGTVMQSDPLEPLNVPTVKNLKILKSTMAAAVILRN